MCISGHTDCGRWIAAFSRVEENCHEAQTSRTFLACRPGAPGGPFLSGSWNRRARVRATASAGRGVCTRTARGVCLATRLLLPGKTALGMAHRLLVASAVPARVLGQAPLLPGPLVSRLL